MKKDAKLTDSWQYRLASGDGELHVHLIGIGGTGLGPIAWVLHQSGFVVSGSDVHPNQRTADLEAAGVTVYPEQVATNLTDRPDHERPDVILISSAIGEDNPERRAAESLGLPVVKRQQFLHPLLAERKVIGVAGSHGKSTTTAMIVKVLHHAGVDAGYIIGSDLPGFGNAHAGSSPYFVIEADEYDRMFLGLRPHIAVLTNVEWDHPDLYTTPGAFRRAFMQFIDGVERDGLVISCGDDAGAEGIRLYASSRGTWITYGTEPHVDLRAVDPYVISGGGYSAEIHWWGALLGTLRLLVPGLHNLWNALAAVAVARSIDIPMDRAFDALGGYTGIARRFELKGDVGGIAVIDDYAHHPTEVVATLTAARKRYPERRIWAVFQPHTFSRTQQFLDEMAHSFDQADHVLVTDIYAAREADDGSVSAQSLVAASNHPQIALSGDVDETARHLADSVEAGDVVVTLGAGTSYRIGELLLEELRQAAAAGQN